MLQNRRKYLTNELDKHYSTLSESIQNHNDNLQQLRIAFDKIMSQCNDVADQSAPGEYLHEVIQLSQLYQENSRLYTASLRPIIAADGEVIQSLKYPGISRVYFMYFLSDIQYTVEFN